ncbi:MAG: DUF5723 family protein [Chloroherpetonaceae bacterium]|nr:DUF5723 family protein [Chloroherpetonaceae bacterium]
MRTSLKSLFFCCFYFLLYSFCYSQISSFNGVNTGTLSSGSAVLTGIQALEVNPSRLSAKDDFNRRLTILFPSSTAYLTSNSFSISLFNRLFGRSSRGLIGDENVWTNEDKDLILNSIDKSLTLGHQGKVSFGFAYDISDHFGAVAFLVNQNWGARGEVNEDIIDFALNGNDKFLGREVLFDNSSLSGWWNREYALSYSRFLKIGEKSEHTLYFGLTLKAVETLTHFDARLNSSIYNSPTGDSLAAKVNYQTVTNGGNSLGNFFDNIFGLNNSTAGFSFFPEVVGSGFGADIGASLDLKNGIRFGVSFLDLGSVSFDGTDLVRNADTTISFVGITNPLRETERENQFDSLKAIAEYQNRFYQSSSIALPTRMRIGAGFDFEKFNRFPLILSFDLSLGFNDNFGNGNHFLALFGAEYRPLKSFPIRAGLGTGGDLGFRLSLGAGYEDRSIAIDVSTMHFPSLVSLTGTSFVSAAVSFRFKGIDRVEPILLEDFVPIEMTPIPAVQPKPTIKVDSNSTPKPVAKPAPKIDPAPEKPIPPPTPVPKAEVKTEPAPTPIVEPKVESQPKVLPQPSSKSKATTSKKATSKSKKNSSGTSGTSQTSGTPTKPQKK